MNLSKEFESHRKKIVSGNSDNTGKLRTLRKKIRRQRKTQMKDFNG